MIHSYPWYIQDWLLSRARATLTLAQRGLWREVLDICYNSGGVVPFSEDELRRMCGVEKSEWNRAWPAVKKMMDEVDGHLSHPKVRETICKLEGYHAKRVEAGRNGAKRRWQKDSSANSSANGSAMRLPLAKNSLPQPLPQPLPLPQPQPLPQPSKSEQPNRTPDLFPVAEEAWGAFVRLARERNLLPGSPMDWSMAYSTWKVLDWEQKLAATDCLRNASADDMVHANSLPQNWLANRKWQRPQRTGLTKAKDALAAALEMVQS